MNGNSIRTIRQNLRTTKNNKNIFKWFLIPLILAGFSLLEVFSASRFRAVEMTGNAYYFVIMHIIWLGVSILLALIAYKIPTVLYKHSSRILYIIALVSLIIIFGAPSYNGAHRWFQLGNITTIQPSEFVKIALILFVALYLSTKYLKIRPKNYDEHIKKQLLPLLGIIAIPLFLIFLEPDLSTAGVIGVSVVSMILFAEKKYWKKDLLVLGITLLILGSLGIAFKGYRSDRLKIYTHLLQTGEIADKYGNGYQMYNILLGIGSGGLWGKGIGQSRQKEGYLLETTAFTDSIAAVAFEELGFVLSAMFILTYLYYFIMIIKQASITQHSFNALVLWGSAHLILLQAIIHFAVNVGLIPITGIALPFMTYGGSSLGTMGIIVGIVANMAQDNFAKGGRKLLRVRKR